MRTFTYQQRVYFSDTDAEGIVYHARYLDFAEHARSELARELGGLLLKDGCGFVVKSITIDYKHPAQLDDLVTVTTTVEQLAKVFIIFHQVLSIEGHIVADMHVKAGWIDLKTKRPVRMPQELVDGLSEA